MFMNCQLYREVRRLFVPILALGLLAVTAGCRDGVPQKAKASTTAAPVSSAHAGRTDQPSPGTHKRFLLVHSYHPEYHWVQTITEGVQNAIKGRNIDLDVVYMDTKRHPGSAWATQAAAKAEARIAEFKPDVVLTIDDDAQTYLGRKMVDGPIPVVFCGVDADPAKYGYPAENVTGIIERPHFSESVALAGRLRPIHKIAVMSSNDSTSIAALGFLKQEVLPVPVQEWRMVGNFDEWKQAVIHFNSTVDALVIRSYQAVPRAGGKDIEDPSVVAQWTVEHATIPTIAFHDFEIADGLLVGMVKSGQEYGRMAAEYAIQIADGVAPARLPVARSLRGIPMVNRSTAARLGIALPADFLKDVQAAAQR